VNAPKGDLAAVSELVVLFHRRIFGFFRGFAATRMMPPI